MSDAPGDGADVAERERIESFRMSQYVLNQTPGGWLSRAVGHKRAADLIYDVVYAADTRITGKALRREIKDGPMDDEMARDYHDSNMLSQYFLLSGYALENCFKGYLVGRDPQLVAGGKLDGFVRGHDLCKLAGKCGLSLSDDENELLSLITRYVVWGKYTAPLDVKDMPSYIDPNEQSVPLSLMCRDPHRGRRVQSIVDSVFTRIAEKIVALRSPS